MGFLHWMDECEVPVETRKLPIDSRKPPDSATLRERNDSPDPSHRMGTCYIDPTTGETVMPPDFFGEKELRWKRNESGNRHEDEFMVTDKTFAELDSEQGSCIDIEYRDPEDGMTDGEAADALDAAIRADGFDVPYPVQQFMFEELADAQAEYLHDILNDHMERIIEMARRRHRTGYAVYGSAAYQWDAETRLTNVLEELADSVVYLTTGPIE